jgi:preprotein translocase subunit YajC
MSFFISDAMAAAPQGQGDALTSLLPLVFIFIVFYFLLIRPQSKKAKEHKQMLGRITKVGDNFVELEIAEGVTVKVQRHAAANLMPKGTIKGL